MESRGLTTSMLLDSLVRRLHPTSDDDCIRYHQRILSSTIAIDQEQLPPSLINHELSRKLNKMQRDDKSRTRCADLLRKILGSELGCGASVVRLLMILSGDGTREPRLHFAQEEVRKDDILKSMVAPREIKVNHEIESNALLTVPSFVPVHAQLVRDVLYVFQGIDGHSIRFEGDGFKLSGAASADTGVKNIVLRLSELGYLYKLLAKSIDEEDGNYGLVRQSFFCSLRDELTEYFRLIAVLESQVELEKNQLTLRQLLVWSSEPLRRLQLMGEMVDSTRGLFGGSLASVVHMYSTHGDPFISEFVDVILKRVSSPIFDSIRLWVMHGELNDVCGEFFVSSDASVPNERLWFDKYKLQQNMVPAFINNNLSQKIFLIGKSINFIRSCCSGSDWTVQDERNIEADFASLESRMGESTKDNRTVTLLRAIDHASMNTNTRLKSILFEQFNLLQHCRVLKQYVLLGQGDSIQYLMDLLGPDLSQPASSTYRHNLIAQLETAVRAGHSHAAADDILERLDVKLLEASPGDVGWDIFVLDYHLDQPLNCVINKNSMKRYHEIFSFLWRLKRVEYSLSSAWQKEMTTEHVVRELTLMKPILHKFHMLRNEMIHFVSNLHSYIMFEVLETSWENLVDDMNAANNMDEIVKAHDEYLNRIMDKSLIGSSKVPKGSLVDPLALRKSLQNLFDLILRFCSVQKRLYTGILEQVNKHQRTKLEVIERTQNSKWGIDEADEGMKHFVLNPVEAQQAQLRLSSEYSKHLTNISAEYRVSFKDLLSNLKLTSSENLRFLCFRLDFNMFYDQ